MNTTWVIVVIFLVPILIIALAAKKRVVIADTPVCTVSQIPAVFERLTNEGRDGSFAVFMFQPPNKPSSDDAINIQFSIEGGPIGLDWCITGPSNIRDKEKFERRVLSLGYKIGEREMNQVKYLRTEDGDLPRLCQKVVCDLYEKNPETKLELVVEGFSWP